jgi:caffeoyl-CoA O-methyltransferase
LINDPAVTDYLTGLEPEPDPLLAEMRAHGERDRIPIVHHVTGGLLEVLAAATQATRAVEVGTAIGVSTLHLARGGAHVTSFEVDPERHEAAREYLARDGRAEQVDLRLQDATEGLAALEPASYDLAFIDGPKDGYATHLDEAVRLLRKGGLLLVDNVLMGGGAATGEPTNQWGEESVALIRAFNDGIKRRDDLRATFLPVGDGVAMAVRQ